MDIVDELLAVVRALEAASVPYAICGGLAVAIHGRPRLTVDIDLVVPKPNMQQAIDAAKFIGFDLETGPTEPPSDLKRRSRGWSDDMSSKAIDCRLAKVSQLYAAWKTLNPPQAALTDLAAGTSQDAEHKTVERQASE